MHWKQNEFVTNVSMTICITAEAEVIDTRSQNKIYQRTERSPHIGATNHDVSWL